MSYLNDYEGASLLLKIYYPDHGNNQYPADNKLGRVLTVMAQSYSRIMLVRCMFCRRNLLYSHHKCIVNGLFATASSEQPAQLAGRCQMPDKGGKLAWGAGGLQKGRRGLNETGWIEWICIASWF